MQTALTHLESNFDKETALNLFEIAMVSINDSLNSIQKQDREEKKLVDDFHCLKGILLNLGLPNLAEQSSTLQHAVTNGTLKEEATTQESLLSTLTQLLEYK